jgi:hypothetical protein
MAKGQMKVNVRVLHYHVVSTARFPWLKISDNPCHRKGSGLDPKTKLLIGEFRSKPEWRPFEVYRFFGMV